MKKANCITLKKLGILFVVMFHSSLSFAGDYIDEAGKDLFLPGRILTVAANSTPEWMSASGQYLFVKNKNYSLVHFPSIISQQAYKKGVSYEIGKAIDQMSGYFFRYFSVDDYSSNDPEARLRLKSRIRSYKQDPQTFELNLSFDIGYHSADSLNIDAIRIESFFHYTFVTTIYHYEKREIELGLSNVMINKLLLDGMKLEIQTNPYINSGAVLLTMAM